MLPSEFELDPRSLDNHSFGESWCDLPEGSVVQIPGDGGARQAFLPCHYEPGYQYPLVVWMQSAAGDDLVRWMPEISDRNFIGVSANGPRGMRVLFGQSPWPQERTNFPAALSAIDSAIDAAAAEFSIHPDRIFIAGAADAAALALTAGLIHPRRFAGVIAVDPGPAPLMSLLREFRRLQGRRAFVATQSLRPTRSLEELVDLLVTAGVDVARFATADVARELNGWLLTTACGAAVVR